MGCSIEEAQVFVDAYAHGFKGISEFKKKGAAFVKSHGYVVMSPLTGHCMYWWDWDKWKEEGDSFTKEFWDDYREHHKGTGDAVAQIVKHHSQAGSKWERMALNGPTQGEPLPCINSLNSVNSEMKIPSQAIQKCVEGVTTSAWSP